MEKYHSPKPMMSNTGQYSSSNKERHQSANVNAKSFVHDILGDVNDMDIDDKPNPRHIGYNVVYEQHKNRWQKEIQDKDYAPSAPLLKPASSSSSNNGGKEDTAKNFVATLLRDISSNNTTNVSPQKRLSTNNYVGNIDNQNLDHYNSNIQKIINDHLIIARDFTRKSAVLYRDSTLRLHNNQVRKYNHNYPKLVNSNLNPAPSSKLYTVDDYIQSLYKSRTCLVCSSVYTFRDSIGRYGCRYFNSTHTDSPNDIRILNSPRIDNHGCSINPFEGYMAASAAFVLIPTILLEKQYQNIGNNRINILHAPSNTIIARYESFDDLYKKPILVYKQGTKLMSFNSNSKKILNTTTVTYNINDCGVPEDRIWVVNISELYFNSFANGLDPISFNDAMMLWNNNKGNYDDDYDRDNMEDDTEDDDDDDGIPKPQRWNNENALSRDYKTQLELMAVKYGRTERPLYNEGPGKEFIDSIFNDLVENPTTKKDTNPIFIPFVVIPKLASLVNSK